MSGLRQRRDHEAEDHARGEEEARHAGRRHRQRGRHHRTLHRHERTQGPNSIEKILAHLENSLRFHFDS